MDITTQTTQLEPWWVRLQVASIFASVENDEKLYASQMISLVGYYLI